MSNSKLITSGLFAFTSAFLVYLILKKNKKTLNLLLNDNLTEKQIDNIFNEEYQQAWQYSTEGRSLSFGIKRVY